MPTYNGRKTRLLPGTAMRMSLARTSAGRENESKMPRKIARTTKARLLKFTPPPWRARFRNERDHKAPSIRARRRESCLHSRCRTRPTREGTYLRAPHPPPHAPPDWGCLSISCRDPPSTAQPPVAKLLRRDRQTGGRHCPIQSPLAPPTLPATD